MSVSAPSRLKRFWPEVLRVQEALERLGRVEPVEDAALLLGRDAGAGGASTCSWIHSFWSGSWMCMYSTPTVRAYASRSTPRMSRSVIIDGRRAGAEAADGELAVEVPDREAVVRDVELGVRVRLAPAERVEVRDEVAAHAVHVDELVDVHDLLELARRDRRARLRSGLQRAGSYGTRGSRTCRRRSRRRRAAGRGSGAGTRRSRRPDDAVVVGARERDDLAHAELRRASAGRRPRTRPGTRSRRRRR